MAIVTVGIDLARNVFAVHGVVETGKPAREQKARSNKKGQVLHCHTESNPAAAKGSSGISRETWLQKQGMLRCKT